MALTFWETVRGVHLADALTAFTNKNRNLEKELSRLNDNLEAVKKLQTLGEKNTPTPEEKQAKPASGAGDLPWPYTTNPYDTVSNEDLQDAIDNDVDIVAIIFSEMESDGENESGKILRRYMNGTERDKFIINDILVGLCGWSMPTILERAKGTQEEEE